MLFAVTAGSARAETSTDTHVDSIHNPDKVDAIDAFSWQKEWGSIHLNSVADGLNDPGTLVTDNGQLPCPAGALCGSVPNPGGKREKDGKSISNGIKYDIKNSLVNCLAKQIPNWAVLRGATPAAAWPYMGGVCDKIGMIPGFGTDTPPPPMLMYMPFYEKRSNDLQTVDEGALPGCVQQITNTCGDTSKKIFIRDIHDCLNTDAAYFPPGCEAGKSCDRGYEHPTSHIFSPDEVADLGGAGAQIPVQYYVYSKKISGGTRMALSKTDPSNFSDRDKSVDVKVVDTSNDPYLARLRGYHITNQEDGSKFILMDPADLYDMKLYVSGGKYDTGYTQRDPATHNVLTPETCPVLGITGYGGICDPAPDSDKHMNAGCNTPIYGMGPSTTFTDVSGNHFQYNDFPVMWSGYIRQWSVISVTHYLADISGRESVYQTPDNSDLFNRNIILKLARANDYCTLEERSSATELAKAAHEGRPLHPDMDCYQYLQYQELDVGKWTWMDLYSPDAEMNLDTTRPRFDTVHQFNIDGVDNAGKIKWGSAVPGTGPGGKVSLKDDVAHTPAAVYYDKRIGASNMPAVTRLPPVVNQKGMPTAGQYLNGVDATAGTGIGIDRGTMSVIRMPEPLEFIDKDGKKVTSSCAAITVKPDAEIPGGDSAQVFVPTNSQEEVNRFLAALSTGDGVSARNCLANFAPNTVDGMPLNPAHEMRPEPIGKTWWGKMDCSKLMEKPSCNETKLISASRLCQMENGMFAGCDECKPVDEPEDHAVYAQIEQSLSNPGQFAAQHPGTEFLVFPVNWGTRNDRCRVLTACMNISAAGCPSVHASGGHVFCFAGETKITMANGSQKAIRDIKAGDKVMAFDAKHARNGALAAATVKATAITKKQKIVKINHLRVTPLHKIVLANGRSVQAQDIKVGDRIMTAAGTIETVTVVDKNQPVTTVYNLVLEKGMDGYVAGGVRVMSYPILKGMDDKGEVKLAKAKGKARAGSRHTSRLKR